jgi:peptide/nickel transport system permease protein
MTASTAKPQDLKAAHKNEPSMNQWVIAWQRLRRHRLAMMGLVMLGIIVVMSLSAGVIAPYPYDEINLDNAYAPVFSPDVANGSDAAYGPMHILGTDKLGRDIFSRLLYAGRISLTVALIVTVLNVSLGTVVGSVAGAYGGWTDTLLMRLTDVMLTLPELPLLLILSSSLRQFVQLQDFLGSNLSVVIIIVVLVMFGWMTNARLVRGSVLSLRSQEFVDAARALGADQNRVITRHLVPNSLAPIIVSATLGFGAVIISESALSFLGFGVMPPVPTWGNMLNEARNSPLEYLFTQALAPGFMIFLTVLSINFIGDGLRDALDPRLKK